MFSTNQLIFAALFVVVFIGVMIVSYRKDKKLHKKHFKGSAWILVGFVVFVAVLLAAKLYLKE